MLQSLGTRRGQLDQREQDLDVQTQLLTAAETKLDAKLQALANMKGELQKLLDEGDAKKSGEIDALVTVYSKMRPRDAADRLALLDDSVRLPIAAKMKPAALSQIVGQMPPAAAKELTEKLAGRFESKLLADARQAVSGQPPAGQAPAANAQAANGQTPPAATPAPAPKKVAKSKSRKAKAATTQLAANSATPPAAGTSSASTSAPAASGGAASPAAKSAAPPASAPAAAKSG